jgi:hypothetical protein
MFAPVASGETAKNGAPAGQFMTWTQNSTRAPLPQRGGGPLTSGLRRKADDRRKAVTT